MRVLHFYRTYFPDTMGGVEQVIYQIARGTSAYGVETEILTLSKTKSEENLFIDNHLVHRARLDFQIASTGFSLSALLRFIQLAKQVDLIHYHFPWPFMDMVHFSSLVKKPSVVTYHSDIIRQKFLFNFYRPLMHCFLNHVDRIVATSPNYFATSQVLDQYRAKTEVIPIGLDKASYPKIRPELLQYWRTRVGNRFFLFVGMIRYYKGLHILLDAVKGTDFPLVILGSGPVEKELRRHAQRLDLKNIHFLGALSDEDKVALIDLSLAIVFPSHLRSEAFGISLLEGAMFGKPMISSEIGTGTSYVNIHNETGLVVPPSNPGSFREAMIFFWNHPKAAAEMGKNAEARYWRQFTSAHMAVRYVDLYQRLLEKSAGSFKVPQ
ncbi:Glycosyl transferase, group 1 [Nitrosococcus oceani ATCC 19707]|uniref:Glycosyl transferase, group 1 n=2 Tax=Nitrosococcus oceani TaxID=1229 RepID=Q3JBQ9_NITOC|nr:glycosyltransferase family 4 protein [Nitrosococcus oceani]ABA57737.1 Glycosyl transferase, group 1 [Nitrosococcus oceani ATCC 19707]EDZ67514.1 glycosyl transferase, group 1 family protein [Nitrosococcus oceani AFC27]KFI19824.1 glycosyl transferase family 1 [Nitrosococcus oceani C-27]GEM19392.1 glycosyl transferase family 1 [Nitrosococcus oceani]